MLCLGVQVGHDSGAALLEDGEVVAAVSEERFVGIKHFSNVPINAIEYCLKTGGVSIDAIDILAIPTIGMMVALEPFFRMSDNTTTKLPGTGQIDGRVADVRSRMLREARSLFKSDRVPDYFRKFPLKKSSKVLQVEHHLAHAASAAYTCAKPQDSLIITADGIGDEVSTAVWIVEGGELKCLYRAGANGSLGWFYGAVTEGLGWWVSDGEGKTMALAAYGTPQDPLRRLRTLCPSYQDGHLQGGHDFGPIGWWTYTDAFHWHLNDSLLVKSIAEDFGRENTATAAQGLLEEEMMKIVQYWTGVTGKKSLACAGGVFLNVKMNQRILESGLVEDIHIFPNAGDGGLAVGAAFCAFDIQSSCSELSQVYWGPEFAESQIESFLKNREIPYERVSDVPGHSAELLSKGKAVGWFRGRAEFGPRALGNRSVFMSPKELANKDIVNNKIKFREQWRPFGPSILAESASDYFEKSRRAPFMILSLNVLPSKKGEIPAVIHVDGTARPQTVERSQNEGLWCMIDSFGKITSTPLVLNTSFNLAGKPIVNSIDDAVTTFFGSGLDNLFLGDILLQKNSY